MKTRRRIRRRAARKAPKIRRSAGGGGLAGAKERMAEPGGLMIGGAKDPAEAKADARAADALGTAATAHRAPAAGIAAPSAAPARASKTAETAVNALGPGRPLSTAERGFYEPRLDADLSPVRLHEDATADKASRAMDAQAFTLGTDIAFAKDERARCGTGLMAHELAHAAEGGGEVRRRIHYPPRAENFIAEVKTRYALDEAEEFYGDAWAMTRKDTGDLEGQIVQSMLWSDRIFRLEGSDTESALTNLEEHVQARWSIVEEAKRMHVGFTSKRAKFDHRGFRRFVKEADKLAYLRTSEEFKKKLKAGRATIAQAEVDWSLVFYEVLNEAVETNEYDDLLNALSDNNMFADEPSLEGARYQYRLSCFMATLLLMFAGGRSALMIDQARGKSQSTLDNPLLFGISGMRALDQTSQAWLDWVPGDWGFIENDSHESWIDKKAAQEGENFVYIGDGSFWAHFNDDNTIPSLEQLMELVRGWGLGAKLTTLRVYPAAGLSQ